MADDGGEMQFLRRVSEICGRFVNRILETANERLSKELSDLKSRDHTAAPIQELNSTLDKMKEDVERLEQSNATLLGQLEVLNGERGNLEQSNKTAKHELVKTRRDLNTKDKEIADMQNSFDASVINATVKIKILAAEQRRLLREMTDEKDLHQREAARIERGAQQQTQAQARMTTETSEHRERLQKEKKALTTEKAIL